MIINKSRERLVLGTVQLGQEYGVANRVGVPSINDARNIIQTAYANDIVRFDTATSYGNSQKILQNILVEEGLAKRAKVVTKITIGSQNEQQVYESILAACSALSGCTIECMMVHDENALDKWPQMEPAFRRAMNEGLFSKVGVSVYSIDKAFKALEYSLITALQIPGNVFDTRFADDRFIDCVGKARATLYVRSVFLQGLLLMNPLDIPGHLMGAIPLINDLHNFSVELGVTRPALLLGYCAAKWPDAFILFGAEKVQQVLDNIDAWDEGQKIGQDVISRIERLVGDRLSEYVIRPDLWKKT